MRAFEISFVMLKGQGPFVWSSSFPCHQKLGWMFCRRALDRGLHLELVPRRCATAARFFFYSGLQHPSQFFLKSLLQFGYLEMLFVSLLQIPISLGPVSTPQLVFLAFYSTQKLKTQKCTKKWTPLNAQISLIHWSNIKFLNKIQAGF